MRQSFAQRLADLEECRRCYGKGCSAQAEKLLEAFQDANFQDAESLIRFHDLLLFLRAFPQSGKVVKLTEELLAHAGRQVAKLRKDSADLELFEDEQFSGVANTVIRDNFTYEVARWLLKRYPHKISVDWNINEQGRQMAVSLPQLLPLIADDCLVEADTPYLDWLANAAGSDQILSWLLQRIEGLPFSMVQKTAWYDALHISLSWELSESPASRTVARRNPRQIFYHRKPLIQRNQVSLSDELKSAPLPIRKLSRRGGVGLLDTVRDALTVRYRELYGTTRGDPESIVEADAGRGVQIFLWGLPPERRLPLRAYHAGITFKNGVPINYIEGISLFEWMEVGFNTFYTFRNGETAWIYSKVLHLLHQVAGVTCISVYPYQLGHENEEAIKSGAFWFYRKLGFRPGHPELLSLTQREEAKMVRNPTYRSSASTLRKLASRHMFYEFGEGPRGLWDIFSVRQIGLAVQRCMASRFRDDPSKMCQAAVAAASQVLGIDTEDWSPLEHAAFQEFAIVLSLVPDLKRWTDGDRQALAGIIRAKVGPDETDYLRRLQHHGALRKALLRLGSG